VNLHVQTSGEGTPVLLIHGFPDSHRLWRHQIGPLTEAGFRTIAPDLRGLGESPKPTEVEAYRLPTIVQEDLIPLLDEAAPAHVVGHDFGAALAWTIALLRPDLVRTLSVLSVGHPNMRATRTLESREKGWYQLLFQFPEAEELFLRDDAKLFREWIAPAADVEEYVADLSRPGAMTAALSYYRANLHPRNELAFRELPPCTVPTLGLWSSGDRFLTERQMQGSGEHCTAGFRYERVEDATHWMQIDQPERVTELLLSHLSARG
jgi:pimeloyl-ACP methyl ester carboxylesterase